MCVGAFVGLCGACLGRLWGCVRRVRRVWGVCWGVCGCRGRGGEKLINVLITFLVQIDVQLNRIVVAYIQIESLV